MTYLTTQEMAVILGFEDRTIREKARKGVLKAIKIYNEWRFPPEEVERLTGRPIERLAPQDGRSDQRFGPGSVARDLGVQAHLRELVIFALMLRDFLFIPHVCDFFAENGRLRSWHTNVPGMLPWLGETQMIAHERASADEEAVGTLWGQAYPDQRVNPLFPKLKAHLGNHPCWSTLADLEVAYTEYYFSSHILFMIVKAHVDQYDPENNDPDKAELEMGVLDLVIRL